MLGTFAPIPETPIAIGPFSTRLPRLQTLSDEEAEAYWDGLGRRRASPAVRRHGDGAPVRHLVRPLAGPRGLPRRRGEAARRAAASGTSGRPAGSPPGSVKGRRCSGRRALSFEAVNKPLEARLLGAEPGQRTVLPFSLDVILTTKGEAASLRVVELQTGLGYAKILWRQLEALGHDASAATSWAGRRGARRRARRRLPGRRGPRRRRGLAPRHVPLAHPEPPGRGGLRRILLQRRSAERLLPRDRPRAGRGGVVSPRVRDRPRDRPPEARQRGPAGAHAAGEETADSPRRHDADPARDRPHLRSPRTRGACVSKRSSPMANG